MISDFTLIGITGKQISLAVIVFTHAYMLYRIKNKQRGLQDSEMFGHAVINLSAGIWLYLIL